MRKILFLLLVCLIKLNAYEYLVYQLQSNVADGAVYKAWFVNENGNVMLRERYYNTGNIYQTSKYYDFLYFNNIKYNTNKNYVKNDIFDSYYKNDLIFLNDLYTNNYSNNNQAFLNYLYNENNFGNNNYIFYDYELLYNSDGLAVESIVNGKWAGLYDGPDKSGFLYNEKGNLKYINGVPVSFFESSFDKLMRRFGINLQSIFIKKIFYPLLVLIFACVVFRSVIRMAFKAFLVRFYDKKIGKLEKRRENIENA